MRIEFRSATRNVHRGNIGASQRMQAEVDRLFRHHFGSIGPGIHMTMSAGLVAELSDIHLERRDTSRLQRKQSRVIKRGLEMADRPSSLPTDAAVQKAPRAGPVERADLDPSDRSFPHRRVPSQQQPPVGLQITSVPCHAGRGPVVDREVGTIGVLRQDASGF